VHNPEIGCEMRVAFPLPLRKPTIRPWGLSIRNFFWGVWWGVRLLIILAILDMLL
jgi:hypothetical protein